MRAVRCSSYSYVWLQAKVQNNNDDELCKKYDTREHEWRTNINNLNSSAALEGEN